MSNYRTDYLSRANEDSTFATIRSREHPADDSERMTRRGGNTFAEERRGHPAAKRALGATERLGTAPTRATPDAAERVTVAPEGGV